MGEGTPRTKRPPKTKGGEPAMTTGRASLSDEAINKTGGIPPNNPSIMGTVQRPVPAVQRGKSHRTQSGVSADNFH